MEFIRISNTWFGYQYPFWFNIFEIDNSFEALCHYQDNVTIENLPSLEIAKQCCYEFALKETLKLLQAIAPTGGATQYIDYEWRFTCGRAIDDMGYKCCLPIGHKGKCWSNTKQIEF